MSRLHWHPRSHSNTNTLTVTHGSGHSPCPKCYSPCPKCFGESQARRPTRKQSMGHPPVHQNCCSMILGCASERVVWRVNHQHILELWFSCFCDGKPVPVVSLKGSHPVLLIPWIANFLNKSQERRLNELYVITCYFFH